MAFQEQTYGRVVGAPARGPQISAIKLRSSKGNPRQVTIQLPSTLAQKARWRVGQYIAYHLDKENRQIMLKVANGASPARSIIRQKSTGSGYSTEKTHTEDTRQALLGTEKQRLIAEADLVRVNADNGELVFKFSAVPSAPAAAQ